MRTTIHTGEPPSATTRAPENTENRVAYDVGFALIVLLFILILIYTSYMCNRIKRSPSPPPASDSDTEDFHSTTLSIRLEDDVLATFPTFVYSDTVKETLAVGCGTGCAICLGDYMAPEVVRLLPECGHLFHCKCIDTWFKVHATCPVCRSSPVPEPSELS